MFFFKYFFSRQSLVRQQHDSSIETKSESVYNRKRIILSKASNPSFSDCLCFFPFKFIDPGLSIFQTANLNHSENK